MQIKHVCLSIHYTCVNYKSYNPLSQKKYYCRLNLSDDIWDLSFLDSGICYLLLYNVVGDNFTTKQRLSASKHCGRL